MNIIKNMEAVFIATALLGLSVAWVAPATDNVATDTQVAQQATVTHRTA